MTLLLHTLNRPKTAPPGLSCHLRISPFFTAALAALMFVGRCASAPGEPGPARIAVDLSHPGPRVSPKLWGIFFEDINCSADGGIYAELVRNRSFEDSTKPEHWSPIGSGGAKVEISIVNRDPVSPKNPHALKVVVTQDGAGRAGVANDGYWGIPVQKGATYQLSFQVRPGPGFTGPLDATIEALDGKVYAEAHFTKLADGWNTCTATLEANATDPKARLAIIATQPGEFWLDMVSLFPSQTWRTRPNGLRPDLADMLSNLKPSFMRFPGGCWVEGDTMPMAYRWKQTIGDISERRTQFNIWNYYASHGLGFHEYLQLCGDLCAEPLFVINCGMSHKENTPMNQMGEFVQDALDAIEYCNGPADSRWGSERAKAGHPAPFGLKYMEIGNENGGPAYQERYALFYDAIKARYPGMTLIANLPTTSRPADVVDEHYYSSPEFFIREAHHYDGYARDGAKVYVGEYAVTQGAGLGNLRAAVGEAAFMTGLERNSDVVLMASYAPLFVNVNHRGWNPDLIAYDNSRAYGIPSYYVQKMFSENRGDVTLPVQALAPVAPVKPVRGAIGVGTWRTRAEFKDMKVTRDGRRLWAFDPFQGTNDWKLLGGNWSVQEGVLRQTSEEENVRAIAGNEDWSDYTFSVKARKLAGAEGFLILYAVREETGKSWWNLGGWGNTLHGLEGGERPEPRVAGTIELGRWYDIRVELKGARVSCFLDGKLVHDVEASPANTLCASATRKEPSGEVILKLVNAAEDPLAADIRFTGAPGFSAHADALMLTSEHGTDENSLAEPTKVVPFHHRLTVENSSLNTILPANSVSVIRLQSSPDK